MSELLRPIVLVGPPGAGKTTLGRLVAARARLPFVDVDERIRERHGRSSAELLADEGELSFRVRELEALNAALDASPPALVAAGSGVVTSSAARALLRQRARIVLVDVAAPEALRRLALDDVRRPLLEATGTGTSEVRYRALVHDRQRWWSDLASDVVDTTALTSEAAADALLHVVTTVDRPVVARRDVADPALFVDDSGLHPLAKRDRLRALVLDAGVPESTALHALLEALGPGPIVRVTGGERCKTLDDAGRLAASLVEAGLPPDGLLVAAGGGATLDLAGFVAATLYRGVPWIALPTTLLAMVDAGLGGKTAVNLAAGKNLVGAFHAPSLLVTDPRFLATLPLPERRAGVVEMLKHAFLASDAPDDGSAADLDEGLPRLAQGDASDVDVRRLIGRSLALKSAVTTADPRERGLRKVLNLGHTLGHALEHESASRGAPLLHGEAVAYGLRFAIALSQARCSLEATVASRLLARVDELDVTPGLDLDLDAVLERMVVDKKRRGSELRFIALAGPGRPVVVADVPHDVVRACAAEALGSS